MAKFRFRFASNLRLKERIEEQRKQEYGRAIAALEREKQRKLRMLKEREDAIHSFRESINRKITPFDLQMHNNFLSYMKERLIKQDEAIKKAEEEVEKRRLILVEAMKERKILEKLREKDYETFKQEQLLAEQKIQDEIVSYRYSQR